MNRGLFEFKNWEQAAVLQSRLASEIVEESPPRFRPRRASGIDVVYRDDRGFASTFVWDMESATGNVVFTFVRKGRRGHRSRLSWLQRTYGHGIGEEDCWLIGYVLGRWAWAGSS